MLNTISLIFEILFLFLFPIFLLAGRKYFRLRIPLLVGFFCYTVVMGFSKYSLSDLGIRNYDNGFIFYFLLLILTALPLIVTYVKYKGGFFKLPIRKTPITLAVILYLFVSALIQEFIYRGYLFAHLSEFEINSLLTILLIAFLFGWLHIFFLDKRFIVSAYAFGFLSMCIFYVYPNFVLAVLVHTVGGLLMHVNYE